MHDLTPPHRHETPPPDPSYRTDSAGPNIPTGEYVRAHALNDHLNKRYKYPVKPKIRHSSLPTKQRHGGKKTKQKSRKSRKSRKSK